MSMRSESGRIVIDVQPTVKRRLYAALSLSGLSLKDWFMQTASDYCSKNLQQTFRFPPCPAAAHPKATTDFPRLFTVVSLFSGCGGMDLGFTGGFTAFKKQYRRLPFDLIWANDINPAACKTYEKNLGKEIHCGDIWALLDQLPDACDVVVGGFPCQDISVNGKRAGVNGSRSGLYKAMVEVIKKTRPKIFVAENVKALLRHEAWLKQVLGDFRSLGYNVHYHLYQAADYGVPQTRERVIFVGTAPGVAPYTPPKPERDAASWITAKEAIGDLESMNPAPTKNHIWSFANVSPEQGNRKLIENRPGYTIRAECHGNIQFHYSLPRRISMREAARIQSFPDKYVFNCGIREMERQIGNAVPPVLAWHIAKSILESLEAPTPS